jgi:hypothetical protein
VPALIIIRPVHNIEWPFIDHYFGVHFMLPVLETHAPTALAVFLDNLIKRVSLPFGDIAYLIAPHVVVGVVWFNDGLEDVYRQTLLDLGLPDIDDPYTGPPLLGRAWSHSALCSSRYIQLCFESTMFVSKLAVHATRPDRTVYRCLISRPLTSSGLSFNPPLVQVLAQFICDTV